MKFPLPFLRLPGAMFMLLLAGIALSATSEGADIQVKPGYHQWPFFEGLTLPTSICFGDDGWLYASSITGQITAMADLDSNTLADTSTAYAGGYGLPLGIAWHNGWLYVSHFTQVVRLRDLDGDHVADVSDTLITGLPTGQHQNNGIAFDSDGYMYLSVGALSNLERGSHPWYATILKFTDTGQFVEIVAEGVRNAYDIAVNYADAIFSCDNGPTAVAGFDCFEAPEELNWIVPEEHYGFPDCFGKGNCADVSAYCDPAPCGAGDCERNAGCQGYFADPIWLFDPHSSANGMTFGTGFDGFDKNDLFVTQWGQNVPVDGCPSSFGHKVVRVRLVEIHGDFVAMFEEDLMWDMEAPLDVAVGPDGALYVADFQTGIIHRVDRSIPGAVDENGVPTGLTPRLFAFPNPARTQTRLVWAEAPLTGPVTVEVFDVAGRRVAAMGSFENPQDTQNLGWGLLDDQGRRVAPGLYLMQARSPQGMATQKVMVLD